MEKQSADMRIFEANISHQVSIFLHEKLNNITAFEVANKQLFDSFGIEYFFENNDDLEILKAVTSENNTILEEPDRAEYGDFQTNENLAEKVVLHLVSKNISPKIVIEPTCGKGNFIIAALRNFKNVEKVFGVEIYKPYVWETKFNIIDCYLNNPSANRLPQISIVHCDVFDYDFKSLAKQIQTEVLPFGEDL